MKEFNSFIYRHVEHIGNGFSFVPNFQSFAVVTPAIALFAMHIHIGQKVHFYHAHTTAFAYIATSAFYIK